MNYKVIKEEYIEDVKSKCTLLRHKCGAKIVFLENDDKNRVFSIAFRTPPCDNTGKPHIIEHSTLCGSRKYRVKDPFNELDKGTMNTYLNAITYADKTIYPIATINEKEYRIMTDIYLDAVFFPLMYENEGIFRQEGWHCGENGVNGIVYNEMSGAFSDPEEYLDFKIDELLFEDSFYRFDSAGVPKDILKLEYSDFLDYHKKYYQPSNSVIYFYGKLDKAEQLEYLDREYLSKFSEGEAFCDYPDTKIDEDKFIQIEKEEAQASICAKFTACRADDFVTGTALGILCDALINSPSGVLRNKLTEIAEDVNAYIEEDLYRQTLVISASKLRDENMTAEEFVEFLKKECAEITVDMNEQKSEIEALKFYYNECDFGYKPKGLYYATRLFVPFLYGFEDFEILKINDIVEKLYEVDYDELLKKYITTARVCCGKLINGESKEAEVSKEYEINDESLKKYHNDKFDMSVPTIELRDIKKEGESFFCEESENIIFTPVKTDIVYIDLIFDMSDFPEELVPYMGIYKNLIGKLDTDKYGYRELNTAINQNLGGISKFCSAYSISENEDVLTFDFSGKFLYEKTDSALDVFKEMIRNTKFSDIPRIKKLIDEQKYKMKESFYFNGNSISTSRCMSFMDYSSYFFDRSNGIDFYMTAFDMEDISRKLNEVSRAVLSKCVKIALACKEEYRESVSRKIKEIVETDGKIKYVSGKLLRGYRSEGLEVSDIEINNNCAVGKISPKYRFDGKLAVLCNILNSCYMWDNIRIKGGAYGGNFSKAGDFIICSSYRDPKISQTYDCYYSIADYVSSLNMSDEDMRRFIIGTIGSVDTPKADKTRIFTAVKRYFQDISDADVQEMREGMLGCRVSDLRQFGAVLGESLSDGFRCTLGGINEKTELFEKITKLK